MFLLLFLPANIYAGSKQHTLQIYSENLSLHRTKFNDPINASNNKHNLQKLKHKKNYSFSFEHDITSQLHELLMDLKSFY